MSACARERAVGARRARTVPSMRRKGRPMLVCQVCGDFSIRLLIVSRMCVFWPAYASARAPTDDRRQAAIGSSWGARAHAYRESGASPRGARCSRAASRARRAAQSRRRARSARPPSSARRWTAAASSRRARGGLPAASAPLLPASLSLVLSPLVLSTTSSAFVARCADGADGATVVLARENVFILVSRRREYSPTSRERVVWSRSDAPGRGQLAYSPPIRKEGEKRPILAHVPARRDGRRQRQQ